MSDVEHPGAQPSTVIVETLRSAARQRRRVRALLRAESLEGGPDYERFWEPYGVTDADAVVFSILRNEFRHVALNTIVRVELCPQTFEPRRPIED